MAVQGKSFRLDASGKAYSMHNIFLYGYLAFMVIIIYLMIAYRKRLYRRVMYGFYGTMAISFWILCLQGSNGHAG